MPHSEINQIIDDLRSVTVSVYGKRLAMIKTSSGVTICMTCQHPNGAPASILADIICTAIRKHGHHLSAAKRHDAEALCLCPEYRSDICHQPPNRTDCHPLCEERMWKLPQSGGVGSINQQDDNSTDREDNHDTED